MSKLQKPKHQDGPKTIPSTVQLPGKITLTGMLFTVVAWNDDGSPKLFELIGVGAKPGDKQWVLFAHKETITAPNIRFMKMSRLEAERADTDNRGIYWRGPETLVIKEGRYVHPDDADWSRVEYVEALKAGACAALPEGHRRLR